MKILLLGLSTRAVAESAVRGGCSVVTLDYFGDRDQKALVENHSLARDYRLPYSAAALGKVCRHLEFDMVVYTSNLENHPKLVGHLAKRADVSGNTPETLGRVRDWAVLRDFCSHNSIAHPATLLPGEEKRAASEFKWLSKPINRGGGIGIGPWNKRQLKNSFILQAWVDGRPASAAFAADGKRAVLIGLTRQLIGRTEFGASGYSWCGNILPLSLDDGQDPYVWKEVQKMASRLARYFGLKGVGGIDLVISKGPDGRPLPVLVEINPRYTASMELMEQAYGLNIFSIHLEAVAGRLPEFSLDNRLSGPFFGKAIVFTRKTVVIRDTDDWPDLGWKDIPFPGDKIEKGRPVCTVLAQGRTQNECLDKLIDKTWAVRTKTGDLGGRA